MAFEVLANLAPDLFSTPPSLSPSGVLAFTAAPGAYGTALIEVRLVDDGGTVGGGDDAGEPMSFVITITPVTLVLQADQQGWRTVEYAAAPLDVIPGSDAGPSTLKAV